VGDVNRLIIGLILAGGAILGGVVAYSYMQAFTIPDARQEGRDRLVAEQAVQSQKEELERKGDDASLQRMSDYDLCVAYLGRVPECDSLRMQPVSEE
jgi:hypothetical protein